MSKPGRTCFYLLSPLSSAKLRVSEKSIALLDGGRDFLLVSARKVLEICLIAGRDFVQDK